jgi:hypothetical protein
VRAALLTNAMVGKMERIRLRVLKYIPILLIFALASCKDMGVDVPPELSLQTLLTAPETVVVQGKALTLSSSLWRNLMPTTDNTGSPLIAVVYIQTVDSTQFPASVSADAVWIVQDQVIWRSYFADEDPPQGEQRPYRLWRIARNGPQWSPDHPVDVIVRILVPNGSSRLLKAPGQLIHAVY